MKFQNKNHVISAKPHCMATLANLAIIILDSNTPSRESRVSGADDENEGFVGWALPTVFPVFMRLSWWAEPTLLKHAGMTRIWDSNGSG